MIKSADKKVALILSKYDDEERKLSNYGYCIRPKDKIMKFE